MAKFVLVSEAPKKLHDGEYVIERANFLDEIVQNARQAGNNKLTGSNHLRAIAGTIAEKYDPEFSAWKIKPHLYEGRPYETNEDLSAIVVEMLSDQYPSIFQSYLDAKIRSRPMGTKVIYYTGYLQETTPFFSNGIDQLDEKDVETFLGLKPKKVVGKPAISNAEVKKDEEQV